MRATLALLLVLCASPVYAQETNPFAWPKGSQKVAERISDAGVWINIGAQVISDIRSDHTKHALGCTVLQNGIALGASGLFKLTIHRMRPDGSNDNSFLSGHSWHAATNSRYDRRVGATIAVTVGIGRMGGNKHFLSDVGAGLFGGFLASRVCTAGGS